MEIDNKYLTEEEARKQVCPFRCTGEGNCLGSKCMCWKWTGYKIKTEIRAIDTRPESTPRFKTMTVETKIYNRGCCGVIYKEDELMEKVEK